MRDDDGPGGPAGGGQAPPSAPLVVGILGGMGPAATVDFYGKLVAATPAERDQDHLPVVIWADPRVPDRTAALLGQGEDPTPWLRSGVHALARAGADLLAVPCNTAHAYLAGLAEEVGLQLVSIVEETAVTAATQDGGAVGLLATTGTVQSRIYGDALAARGLTCLVPGAQDQARVMEVVAAVKAGAVSAAQRRQLLDVAGTLRAQGAGQLVAGCTELVLALTDDPGVPVLDPARILARRVVELALAGTTQGALVR